MRAILAISAIASVIFGASLALSSDAVEIKSDALKKSPQPDKIARAKQQPLKVEGIVLGPEGGFAIICGRAYMKGEGGEGFIVKEIEPNRVLIESSGGLEYLPLKPAEPRRDVSAGQAGQ